MNHQSLMNGKMILYLIIVGLLIALLEGILKIGNNASLLFTLVFWVSVVEGCIAVVASVEASASPWIKPIKKELLSVYPLLLLFALLFLCMFPKMNIYPWMEMNGKWLNIKFFIIRNVVLLFIVFLVAWKYSNASMNENPNKNFYAILYLLVFVISQSMVAFDWVMSLEYPWVSTLLGGFFFTQSFNMGVATAAIVLYLISRSSTGKFESYKLVLKDISVLMLGFCIIWVGFFFAQYLTIWYGHIPEESSFFIRRFEIPHIRILMVLVLIIMFVIPFLVLLSRKVKSMPSIICLLGIDILVGLILEFYIIITPLVPVNFYLVVLEFIGIGILFTLLCFPKQKNVSIT